VDQTNEEQEQEQENDQEYENKEDSENGVRGADDEVSAPPGKEIPVWLSGGFVFSWPPA